MAAETVTLIDLGDDFAPAPNTASGRSRTQRNRRRVWLALTVVSVLLLVAASGVRPRPRIVEVLRIPASTSDSMQLFSDGIYLWDNRAPVSQTRLTAYNLDGRQRWSRLVPGSGPDASVLQTDRETIVDANLIDGTAHIIALDKASGRPLWDYASTFGIGYPYIPMIDPHGRMLVFEAGRNASRLQWVNTRTGDAIWSEDLAGDWNPDYLANPGAGQRLWLVSSTGDVLGVRVADREDRISRHLDGLAPATALNERSITADGATILVTDIFGMFPLPQHAVLHAYDVGMLAPQWTRQIGDSGSAAFCGTLVCELTNAGVTLVDPVSGRSLWMARSEVARPIGADLVVGPYSAPGAGPQLLVNGRTGQTVADLSSWDLTPVGTSSLLLVQPTRGYMGVWLARLDAGASRPTLLGAVPGMSTRCAATATNIACHAIDGTIAVWRTN